MVCAAAVASESRPTEIYLPREHFSNPDIRVSHGRVEYHEDGQLLLWWHSAMAAQTNVKIVVVEPVTSLEMPGSNLCCIL